MTVLFPTELPPESDRQWLCCLILTLAWNEVSLQSTASEMTATWTQIARTEMVKGAQILALIVNKSLAALLLTKYVSPLLVL